MKKAMLVKSIWRSLWGVVFGSIGGLLGLCWGSVWGPLGVTMSSLSNDGFDEDEESNVNEINFGVLLGVLWASFGVL